MDGLCSHVSSLPRRGEGTPCAGRQCAANIPGRAQAPPQHAEDDTSHLHSSAFRAQKPGVCLSYLKEGATGQCPSGLASQASCAEMALLLNFAPAALRQGKAWAACWAVWGGGSGNAQLCSSIARRPSLEPR